MAPRHIGLATCLAAVATALLAGGALSASSTAVHGATESGRAMPTSQAWDLVWISDSTGWGVAPFYGRQIKQARNVPVRVHDEWGDGLEAQTILRRLKTPSDPWVSLIRDAEVIVVLGNPIGLEALEGGGNCGNILTPPRIVGPRAWPKYIAGMKAIYKRIFEIRRGKPVILRTYTYYVSWLSSWAGMTKACVKRWESLAWAISKAAAAYHVPVADVYTAFNGKTRLEDPVAKGYIQADGHHPNNKGRAVIAETVAALGYRQVKPPR